LDIQRIELVAVIEMLSGSRSTVWFFDRAGVNVAALPMMPARASHGGQKALL